MAWTHLVWESFCLYDSAKDKITESFKFKEDDDGEMLKDKKGDFTFVSCGKHPNPCYIENGEAKRPAWCRYKYGKNRKDKEMTPRPDCYQCPYLALSDISHEEYIVMMKAWDKACKEGKFDFLEDGREPTRASKPSNKKHGGSSK